MTTDNGLIWDDDEDVPPVYVPAEGTNAVLLARTMTYADEHPDEHDQNTWLTRRHCGTKACFAGTALLLAGWTPYLENDDFSGDEDEDYRNYEDYEDVASYFDSPSGERFYARDGAITELGITRAQAEHLFSPYRTIDDLRRAVTQLTKGAYQAPEVTS